MTHGVDQADPERIRSASRVVFSAREFQWRPIGPGYDRLARIWQHLLDWINRLRLSSPLRYYLLVTALVLVLGAFIAQITWTIRRTLAHRARRDGISPAAAAHDAEWHRGEAARLAGEGQFVDALAHRFWALLLELEQRQLLRFDPSKTPAEYVSEVRLDTDGRSAFRALVVSLYRYLFAGARCEESDWIRFDAEAGALAAHVAAS